ncbi:MAG: HPr family phosphocarrier protein [Clostridiales bacterium]|nr:HPr family phosphocarrier protein [Clostridiales bacterium]
MMRKKVIVEMQDGLEARPIAMLVQTASQFKSRIYLEIQEKRVNAKSIMGVMSLALLNGEAVTLDAEGPDDAEAIAALEAFLKK